MIDLIRLGLLPVIVRPAGEFVYFCKVAVLPEILAVAIRIAIGSRNEG